MWPSKNENFCPEANSTNQTSDIRCAFHMTTNVTGHGNLFGPNK